jgi:HEPN domain-containing protein
MATMERDFTKLSGKLTDLDVAWKDRLKDAEALLDAGRHGWSMATAHYAVEILLKVMICKKLDLPQLPKAFEIHDHDSLLLLAGLSVRMSRKSFQAVKRNWDAVTSQSPKVNDMRYTGDSNWTRNQAEQFLKLLKDLPDGVLPWLSRQR